MKSYRHTCEVNDYVELPDGTFGKIVKIDILWGGHFKVATVFRLFEHPVVKIVKTILSAFTLHPRCLGLFEFCNEKIDDLKRIDSLPGFGPYRTLAQS